MIETKMAHSETYLSLADMKSLLAGARALGGPLGTTVELSLLTLHPAMDVLGIQLEAINWREGWTAVTGKSRRPVRVALSVDALAAIRHVAGSAGGRGQAVTAGRGKPLAYRDIRLDRLQKKLLPLCPTPISVEWDMHWIRASAAHVLRDDGIDFRAVDAALGFPLQPSKLGRLPQCNPVQQAHIALSRWSQLLGSRPA